MGWYLMLPPMNQRGLVQKTASLSQWEIISSYDTADACEKIRLGSFGWMPDVNGKIHEHTPRGDAAICVASDDPRLAK
jgi:hypothetical protein